MFRSIADQLQHDRIAVNNTKEKSISRARPRDAKAAQREIKKYSALHGIIMMQYDSIRPTSDRVNSSLTDDSISSHSADLWHKEVTVCIAFIIIIQNGHAHHS